jgi:hypothetical protein
MTHEKPKDSISGIKDVAYKNFIIRIKERAYYKVGPSTYYVQTLYSDGAFCNIYDKFGRIILWDN